MGFSRNNATNEATREQETGRKSGAKAIRAKQPESSRLKPKA
jgi:hypothetical protein